LKNNVIKSTLVTLTILAIAACNNTIPNNSRLISVENFSELEHEYFSLQNRVAVPEDKNYFSLKAITLSYLERKIISWLTPTVKGPQLVKELAFAMFKYPELLEQYLINNPDIFNQINLIQQVIDRKNIDPAFAAFLDRLATFGEFQINNNYTTSFQSASSVAMDSDGDYIITWNSYTQDGDRYALYARRYGSSGAPLGSEFQVNTFTTNNQAGGSVAMDSDGDFVIAWQSRVQDGYNYGIFARRYNSAGDPVGSEFQVNVNGDGSQRDPAIAMDNAGGFVIAWNGYRQDDTYGVFARRYDSSGTPAGSEFRVNYDTTGYQLNPSIAMDDAGDFVVSWANYESNGVIYTSGKIFGLRFDSSGATIGSEFQIDSNNAGISRYPDIAMDNAGDFVVSWFNVDQDGGGGGSGVFSSGAGIYAQRYSSTGATVGTEFRVNSFTASAQIVPRVAMDSDGDFNITWTSYDQDGDMAGVYAQRYTSTGATVGTEFRVNTYTTFSQTYSIIAMDSDGDFIIAWSSGEYYGGSGQDGDYYGVYAKRYNNQGLIKPVNNN
jgi:hypothetical protein